jgi:uncharacterized RDD family membrane protein YckC
MQTVRITTSQNIDIDYELAGVADRFLARLIDMGIAIAVMIMAFIVFLMTRSKAGDNEFYVGALVIAYACLFIFYDLLCETLMNGQCIGKRIMKIKVISLNGARPKFSQYLLRWLFRIVDFTLSGQTCGLICAVVTEKQQRLGDIVAGTTVIKTEPRTKINTLAFNPVNNGYQPVFNDMGALTDRDIALIQEVIRSYAKTGNAEIVVNAAARVKEILAVTPPEEMNDLKFLQTIVRDYNHIATVNGLVINN